MAATDIYLCPQAHNPSDIDLRTVAPCVAAAAVAGADAAGSTRVRTIPRPLPNRPFELHEHTSTIRHRPVFASIVNRHTVTVAASPQAKRTGGGSHTALLTVTAGVGRVGGGSHHVALDTRPVVERFNPDDVAAFAAAFCLL